MSLEGIKEFIVVQDDSEKTSVVVSDKGEQGTSGDSGVLQSITYQSSAITTISLSDTLGVFRCTAAAGPTTWAIDGATVDGQLYCGLLELIDGGSQLQTWPANFQFKAGVAPTLTTTGKDILLLYTVDAGASVVVLVLGLDIKVV